MQSSRCRRAGNQQTVEERRIMHRARMLRRKERRAARSSGFTAVPNKRVSGEIAAVTLVFMHQGFAPGEAQQRAISWVARSLPPAERVRNHHVRPSRNSDPAYRRGNR